MVTGLVIEYLGTVQASASFEERADGAEVFRLMPTSELGPTSYLDRFLTGSREGTG